MTYNKNRIYKPRTNLSPVNRSKFITEVYKMFQDELDKRGINITVTDYLWQDLQAIIREYDKQDL